MQVSMLSETITSFNERKYRDVQKLKCLFVHLFVIQKFKLTHMMAESEPEAGPDWYFCLAILSANIGLSQIYRYQRVCFVFYGQKDT